MNLNEQLTTKEGLAAKWESAVRNNQDEYGNAVILTVAAIGRVLDEGGTPEEAGKQLYGRGLSGYMAEAAAHMIAYFHPRADEFRIWLEKLHS